MRAVVASAIAIGALAAVALRWPQPQPAAAPAPIVHALSPARHAVRGSYAATRVSGPPPPIVGDDSPTLIRNIERALVSVDADERERVFENELPELVAIDARSAGTLVERSEPGPIRDVLRGRVARLWAAADLNGALDWVSALDDTGERRLAANDVATSVASSDPATALEVFDLFGIGRADGTVEHVVQLWAEEHPEDALGYAKAQQPGPQRDQLLARIAIVQAARDAASAADP